MKKLKRKISIIGLITLMAGILVTGCGEENDTEENGKYTSKEIYDKVVASVTDLPAMTTVDNSTEDGIDALSYVTELESDKIIDFVYSYSTEGLADEILIIQLKNSDDVKTVSSDLEERLETRKATFSVYDAEEGSKFQGAVVVKNGKYLMLIIGNQAQNGKYAFNELFE